LAAGVGWGVVLLEEGGTQSSVGFPAPLFEAMQLVEFEDSRAFVPLRVHEDRVHLLHFVAVEEGEIWFLAGLPQRLADFLGVDEHLMDGYLLDVVEGLAGGGVGRE
jgi:hypothetical protein